MPDHRSDATAAVSRRVRLTAGDTLGTKGGNSDGVGSTTVYE